MLNGMQDTGKKTIRKAICSEIRIGSYTSPISRRRKRDETRLLTLDSLSLRMCFSSLPVGEPRKDLSNFELEFEFDMDELG